MRQKSGQLDSSSGRLAKNIRRATRKQYPAEEKIRVVLDGLSGEEKEVKGQRRTGLIVTAIRVNLTSRRPMFLEFTTVLHLMRCRIGASDDRDVPEVGQCPPGDWRGAPSVIMATTMFTFKRWLTKKKHRLNVLRSFLQNDINAEALRQVAIFPRLKLCYNRIKKNANSTATIVLQALETGEMRPLESEEAKHAAIKFGESLHSIPNYVRDYDWLLIVRDPYSRTLSAFLEKFQRPVFQEKFGNFQLSREGFADFVLWLNDGGLEQNYHWNLQSKHILLPIACYTKVIRFENFNDEFFRFSESLDPAVSSEILKSISSAGSLHATKSSEKLDYYYTRHSRKIVSELFRRDFVLLDYPIKD